MPDLYAHLITPLAAKVGEVLFTEPSSHDFIGKFYRVWVRINVSKPLKNVVSIVRDKKRQIYRIKYEKLPDWCAVCGMLGHLYKEHGNGIHPPFALVFKDFARAGLCGLEEALGEAEAIVEDEGVVALVVETTTYMRREILATLVPMLWKK